MSESTRYNLAAIVVTYVVTVGMMTVVAQGPIRGLWGFSAYAFWGGMGKYIPAVLGIVWGIVVCWLGGKLHSGASHVDGSTNVEGVVWWAGVHVALMGMLFVVFRAKAHFLGDGYEVLSTFASERPIIKARAFGEAVIHLGLRNILGGATKEGSLASFQVGSIAAGLGYLGFSWFAASRLFRRRREMVLFILGLSTPGFMLLFFGYVELYSVFFASVGVFGLMGLLVAEGHIRRYWIVVPLAPAMGLHAMGVVLIPAAVYVLSAGTRVGARVSRWGMGVKVAVMAALVLGGIGLMWYGSGKSYFFKLAFVPLVANRFTVEGYTLLSAKHLLDMINLALVLFPGALVCLAALIGTSGRGTRANRWAWFIGVLAVSQWGAVFLFDPKIGMPRDWDLFAFAGVSLALACLYPLVKRAGDSRVAMVAVLLALGANGIVLAGRAGLQTQPERSAEQFRQHIYWDKLRHQTNWTILGNFFFEAGDTVQAGKEFAEWTTVFPGYGRNREGLALLNSGKFQEALAAFREVMRANPSFPASYGNVASAYFRMRQLDSAQAYYEIALGMNPYNPAIKANYGQLFWVRNQQDKAAELWREALAADSTQMQAALGLMTYYGERGDRESYYRYLAMAVTGGSVPPARLVELGEYYVSTNRVERGKRYLREAIAGGLDSSMVRQLRQRFPDL